MGEHQLRLWGYMIEATEEYLADAITLRHVIGQLEGSLDASELKNEELIREFYALWEPLEIEYACNLEMGTPLDDAMLRQSVEAMRKFLIRTKERVYAYDPSAG
ncbi:MAG: hypothetical protein GXP29_07725 [Planctomycetes bacterium]|nr:hypothetical protein [Planctomycetota bacterium]